MLKPEDIKQVFFHCTHKDPAGFYANEVDVIEFGQKVAAFALAQKRPMTDEQIVNLMMTVELGDSENPILDRLRPVIRAVESFHGIK